MPCKILIVDDEHLSRNYIKDVILECEPSLMIFEAESAEDAIPILENEEIDILFTDIRMPKTNGFGLLKSVSHRNFDLIFVTAYSQYAIQAIREGACDYLLKPIKKIELRNVFLKVYKKGNEEKETLIRNSNTVDYLSHKLALGHQQGIKYIALTEIIYFEADNTYTKIFLTNGEKIISSKPIGKFESLLSPHWFFRIFKSHIVNIYHVKEYLSRDGDIAVMDNGEKLHISRYRLTEFLKLLETSSGRLKI